MPCPVVENLYISHGSFLCYKLLRKLLFCALNNTVFLSSLLYLNIPKFTKTQHDDLDSLLCPVLTPRPKKRVFSLAEVFTCEFLLYSAPNSQEFYYFKTPALLSNLNLPKRFITNSLWED